jgi:hypothetical protein
MSDEIPMLCIGIEAPRYSITTEVLPPVKFPFKKRIDWTWQPVFLKNKEDAGHAQPSLHIKIKISWTWAIFVKDI